MTKTFKENFVLIAGIALPIILAVIFLAAARLSIAGIDPPKTPVLYQINSYSDNAKLFVRGGKIFYLHDASKENYAGTQAALYLYDPVENATRSIPLPVFRNDETREVEIPVLSGAVVSDNLQSPDGYVFQNGWDSNGGNIITEMFGARNRYRVVLQKGPRQAGVPISGDFSYGSPVFLGWVIAP